jgi:hypothetical protein
MDPKNPSNDGMNAPLTAREVGIESGKFPAAREIFLTLVRKRTIVRSRYLLPLRT